ncbi:MAG: ATP-binding protein [Desulfobulbaceae bacterium]|nr:ATP-binding protein [Desulfobulbaceae bacterium]
MRLHMEMDSTKYRYLFYLMILVLVGNLSSLTGLILRPDIHYFAVEHFIVGGTTCFFILALFIVIEFFLRRNQEVKVEKKITHEKVFGYGWQLAGIWTIIVFASLAWNITLHKQRTTKIALTQAATVFDESMILYEWAKSHRGIFVPVSDHTRPSPYLKDKADHRGSTDSGRLLTLVTPEQLIRKVYYKSSNGFNPYIHMTSLDPLRPENAPDPWEEAALQTFAQGNDELHSVEEIFGKKYLRLMRPIPAEQGCLECHPAPSGSQNVPIRGGISVSIPLAPLFAMTKMDIFTFCMAHGTLLLLGLMGTFLGVTRLSESIREREQAEFTVRSIIENMFEGVITLNEKWRIESCNPAASRMFGYSRVEMLGRRIGTLVKTLQDDQQTENVEQVDGPLLIKAMGSPIELTGERKDGTHFVLEISLSEMYRGPQHLYIAMVRDITERNLANQALLESQARIIKQEKLASLGTMVAGIAHEINNPSQAISFSMDGLKMNMEYVKKLIMELKRYMSVESSRLEEERERIRRVMEEADMDLVLESIDDIATRNIKSVERIDHIVKSTKRMTHSDEVFSPCDLNTIVNDAVVLTHNQVKYDLEVVLDLAPHLPRFQGLPQEMGQVFINLIMNARDAIREKGLSRKDGRIKITTSYNGKRKCLEARFEDNGTGIKKEIIDRIFDPFFTTKEVGTGTGLGLNLCHRIVDTHGGEIFVESEEGKGSSFTVRLFL